LVSVTGFIANNHFFANTNPTVALFRSFLGRKIIVDEIDGSEFQFWILQNQKKYSNIFEYI
jgi:hypothetical protein